MNKNFTKRILAIDLMRAFAIVMMIQGHIIQSLLDVSYQNSDSLIYNIWLFLRAFTAPLFIFASGFIFTFLISQNEFKININPRIIKGIWRGVSLVIIGYLLRYPTINFFNLVNVSYSQWLTFFAVDALHLIGIGLLLIILFVIISSKIKLNLNITFLLLTIALFIGSPFVNSIVWNSSINIFTTSYITSQFGSQFPLFPYLVFMFIGATFGIKLSQNKKILSDAKNIFAIFLVGVFVIAVSYMGVSDYSNILLRIGVVIVLLSVFGFVTMKMKTVPKIIESLARNSLWLYIIHLVIIYGSPVSIGLFQIVGKTQTAVATIIIAVVMLILMTIISLGIDKLRVTKFNVFRKV